MRVKIVRIDKTLPLPAYQTKGSVAFDLYVRSDAHIPAQEISLIPTNIIIQAPVGYMLVIASRSSTPTKKGLMIPHGIGIIDRDYCGPDDELKLQVYNFTHRTVFVKRGERIAQGILVKVGKAEFSEVESIAHTSRGGYGSTG